MKNGPIHRIIGVESGSIAGQLGLAAGDDLLEVNGKPVHDVFDYRMAMTAEKIEITAQTKGGIRIFDIEKDEDEDIGLLFETHMMDSVKSCDNRCLFCFIDQLPAGMRPSLYFKDDDVRMSFLTGNYVTLTNLSDEELDRLTGYRFSPLNLSVHTLSPDLRARMMNNRFAGQIRERIEKILSRQIRVNVQIVLCPGINDGEQMEDTIRGLVEMGEGVASVSVVPVGLTRYRTQNGLHPLDPYDAASAAEVLDRVHAWQKGMLAERGERLVFAADEFYIRAGRALPDVETYEEFPQLENGVGMCSLFLHELEQGLREREGESHAAELHVHAVTGVDFAPLLERHADAIGRQYGLEWTTHAVRNRFFGDGVTVAGLLTGEDVAAHMESAVTFSERDMLLVPSTLIRAEGDLFLDDMTPAQLEQRLGIPVLVTGATAPELLQTMDQITGEGFSV